ncbi:unnamed protein product [Cladocopium goreaui]|uniref:Integrase catalytic domain-containing protein n=1 Tax=Cladocopium goreaui TaxID=2562237 RepID=A0A9P1DM55_9DINO|nr:unnamed protein product [Cladocopium goreaui]
MSSGKHGGKTFEQAHTDLCYVRQMWNRKAVSAWVRSFQMYCRARSQMTSEYAFKMQEMGVEVDLVGLQTQVTTSNSSSHSAASQEEWINIEEEVQTKSEPRRTTKRGSSKPQTTSMATEINATRVQELRTQIAILQRELAREEDIPEEEVPRVGNFVVRYGDEMFDNFQMMVPELQLKLVILCRGTERIAPKSGPNFESLDPEKKADLRRTTEEQIQVFENVWLNWAGPCKTLYLDPAGEYINDQWHDFAQKEGIKLSVAAGESHWQIGRAESHGRIVKQMLTAMDVDEPISNFDQFRKSLRHVFAAKNALSNVNGYSPEQALLGKSCAVPASLVGDNEAATHSLAESNSPEGILFRESLRRRECARKAFLTADNSSALRRAVLRRPRKEITQYQSGDWVEHLIIANRVLFEAKSKPVNLMIVPIAESKVTFCAFSDASFESGNGKPTRQGTLIFTTDGNLAKNQRTVICPMAWSSRKVPRVVRSTLTAESVALGSTLDRLSWLRVFWEWLKNPGIDWSQPDQVLRGAPHATVATDCKSVFDLSTKTSTPSCSEYRTTLECLLIRERLRENCGLRWVNSRAMLADCLTKSMDGDVLRQALMVGQYALFDEHEVLKERADKRKNSDLVLLERQEPVVLEVFWEVLLAVTSGATDDDVALQGARTELDGVGVTEVWVAKLHKLRKSEEIVKIWSFLKEAPRDSKMNFLQLCIKESSSEGNSWWLDLGDREVLDALPVAGHEQPRRAATSAGGLVVRRDSGGGTGGSLGVV